MMNRPEAYVITLRAEGTDDPPPAIRLRQALKLLLRTFRLRCVEAREVPARGPASHVEAVVSLEELSP